MKIYVIWRTSLRSIRNNGRRSFLTMVGIIIGVSSVIMILSLGKSFEKKTLNDLTNSKSGNATISIYFEPSNEEMYQTNISFFHEQDLMLINKVEGIVSSNFTDNKLDQFPVSLDIRGQEKSKQISLGENFDLEILKGRGLIKNDGEILNKVAVIDSELAKELFSSVDNSLGRGLRIDSCIFTIVGIFKAVKSESLFSTDAYQIAIPQKTYLTYAFSDKDTSTVDITVEKNMSPNAVVSDVIKSLSSNGTMHSKGEYKTLDSSVLTDGIGNVLTSITYFISAIAGISLFIAGIGVMNMMYISVSERTKEIGIRRSLGATKNMIRLQFLLEGLTLTMIGGFIGYIIGIVLANLLGITLGLPVSIDFSIILLAVGISSSIGLIFSVVPASEASRKELIDILR
ncbi:ABC transporter permease [Enterococcus sp. BWB1-3]|uniref:ABC transporter permease n=1 Tax=Enterococcus sp. BWB1-3 TaxID=2787713 RepID=UPI0019204B31|nr:ABC transporter permease [Enterococcus sp. BWB1-3]MBL1229292.1 ABC transporter permease [Enterococcus sp. BWB1-3]